MCNNLVYHWRFSPRMRRCFRGLQSNSLQYLVFSAYAEVFPVNELIYPRGVRFLRVCGGVSRLCVARHSRHKFSPRMRRCFSTGDVKSQNISVFSAYAEVFLIICFSVFFPSFHKFLYTLKTFLKLFLILPVLNSV